MAGALVALGMDSATGAGVMAPQPARKKVASNGCKAIINNCL